MPIEKASPSWLGCSSNKVKTYEKKEARSRVKEVVKGRGAGEREAGGRLGAGALAQVASGLSPGQRQ